MFKSYFTIGTRTLLKNKVVTLINVAGLAIGISASLVIWLLVNYHFSFDRFQKDGDRIYRVLSNFSFSGEVYRNSGVTDPMAPAVEREVTGIEQVVPFRTWNGDVKIAVTEPGRADPHIFKKQRNIIFADARFFNLVGYEWVAGSPRSAFNKPYQTVLTESRARLYFPGSNAVQIIGREIALDDSVRCTISGIVKDIKENTDFTFQVFVAYTTLENTSLKPKSWTAWDNTDGSQQLLLKLATGSSPASIEQKIAALYKKHHKPVEEDRSKTWFSLQPLADLHFNPEYGGYELPLASKPTLYGLSAIALFLLLLGCINFINLSTAQAVQRAKEVGIRKTMGSSKMQLVFQFLSETFLLTVIATCLSVVLTPLILKAFEGFMPEGIKFDLAEQPVNILFLGILTVSVAFLAGFYPAIILSQYKPVLVLKNQAYNHSGKTRQAWLRKSLTVSQFVIAQVFIMSALLVSKQLTYTLNKDLGFRKDAILSLQTNYYDTVSSHKFVLMDKLRAIPGIAMVSLSSSTPSSQSTWSGTMKYKDGAKEVDTDVQQKFGDTNYIQLYKLKLLAGTNLEHSDTVKSYLINETYARILGFKDPSQAIGKKLGWSGKQVPIAGVLADFHQKSLHEPIKPLAIGSWENTERTINIALHPLHSGTGRKTVLSQVEKAWKEIYPADDFDYRFFEEDIAKFYTAEQNMSDLLKWATGLAIFISCLGLLGLVMYTTTLRTKEIGVRKVLGASITQIVTLISKDFILLVMIAFLIAAPIGYFGMHKWLQNFAYSTGISWWVFCGSGVLMTFFALVTVGIRTIQAARVNPVKSLKTE